MKKIIFSIIFCFINIFTAMGNENFYNKLADAAFSLTKENVHYDPSYFKIDYPNGDVPSDTGVCTDVIIRAYRKLGIDLQKEVHEDMKINFKKYPNIWKLSGPDTNIDHRRVPNLMTFFKKYGIEKINSLDSEDYHPGDIVCWNLGGAITHIGIVSNQKAWHGKRYLIIHNIGNGQVIEDMLFDYKIIGHYQYYK
jgi:uncharacterized protein YijF (DUF1287 family)